MGAQIYTWESSKCWYPKYHLLVPGPTPLVCHLPLLIVFDPKWKCLCPEHSGFSRIVGLLLKITFMECSGSARGEPFGVKQKNCQTTLPSSPRKPMCSLVVIPLTPAAYFSPLNPEWI